MVSKEKMMMISNPIPTKGHTGKVGLSSFPSPSNVAVTEKAYVHSFTMECLKESCMLLHIFYYCNWF